MIVHPVREESHVNNQSFWGINFDRDPALRAADSDREHVAERLRQSHAEGRLDTTELSGGSTIVGGTCGRSGAALVLAGPLGGGWK